MYQGITLQSAPPFGVVISFFLNAQIYLCIAGLYACYYGLKLDSGLYYAAIVHCCSVGFLLLVMFGALSQMLPVLGGVRLSYPQHITAITLISINLGLCSLCGGFIFGLPWCFILAGVALGFGIGVFVINICTKIVKIQHFTPSLWYMLGALGSLVVVAIFGISMVGVYAGLWGVDSFGVVRLNHVSFGAFGWILLLIIGVCLQVLPMFYVAPAFPKYFYAYIIPSLYGVLILGLVGGFLGLSGDIVSGVSGIISIVFGLKALLTLKNRKRKISDISIFLWYFGFSNLILFGAFCGLGIFIESIRENVLVVLFAFGVFGIVYAMLLKIVPFLSYFHLSYSSMQDVQIQLPNMREIIKPQWAMLQACVFIGFYASVLLSIITNWRLMNAVSGGFACACGMIMAALIIRAYRIYLNKGKI